MGKEIKVFNNVPNFSNHQLKLQAEKQKRFLFAIHPFLDNDNYNDGSIELRPLKRQKELKYVRSFNSWHLQEKDMEELVKFLGLINGQAYCLYYSTFAFDYHKDVPKKDGKPFEKGKINNQNALFTTVLVMDFDGITKEEFLIEKQRLLDLDIETIDIFTGHGFQSIILLDKRVYDTMILRKFTDLLLSKGFKVDSAVVDAARVMRMPYSFNTKALDIKDKYYDPVFPEIHPTTDIFWTDKRYSVINVFQKIQSLQTVIPQIEEEKITVLDLEEIPTGPLISSNTKKEKIEEENIQNIKIQNLASVYNMIDYDMLPDAIKKMLSRTPNHYRNKVMLFLIPFFRNTLGLSIQTVKEVFQVWRKRCETPLDSVVVNEEVDRIWSYGLKGKWGKYDEDMAKKFGYIQFDQYKRDNKIIIPNGFFEEFCDISDKAVRIYFAMKLAEKRDGIKNFTIDDIVRYANISKKTFHRHIRDLMVSYVCKRKSGTYKKGGEKYTYYLNPFFSSVEGYSLFETLLVKEMLKELTDGEIKLYSYICKMIGGIERRGCVWASQEYLANKIGRKRNSVSEMTDRLHDKRFMNKTTTKENGVMHSTYNLNY